VLLFVLMFGAVGVLMASQNVAPTIDSAPIILTEWGVDSPQPDTIFYDDPTVGSYRLYGGTFYCSVRFTPLLDFTLRAAYIGVSVVNLDTLTTVWVTGDAGGFADPTNILATATFRPVNGWNQVDFHDSLNFAANQDFHIVYGPLVATLNPTPGPGTYPLLDSNADNLNRSYYGNTWPSTAPTAPVSGYDWRLRAGGEYAGGGWVDLGINNLSNNILRYFLCLEDVATFRARITNAGSIDVTSYDVEWVVRDETSTTVFMTSGTYGPILVGETITVTAPSAWTASAVGYFEVTGTVTAAGDVIPENNSRLFEQHVNDPTLTYLLRYDIPNFQVNLSLSPGGGRMMKFTPCSYPVEITQMQVEINSTTGNARLRIYGDDGAGNPNPASVLFDSVAALTIGTNQIVVGSIPIASGSFFLAYIYVDATTPTIPMDAEPSAGANLVMPVMYRSVDSGATWALDSGGDHPLRAMVMPFGGIVRDISLDYLTFAGFFVPTNTSLAHQIQVRNNGSATDTFDVTLTIEDTTFARSVLLSESQPVVGLAPGDSALLTYSAFNYAAVGEYIITAQAIAPGDVNTSDNTIEAETQVCEYPSELTYDDGTFENGWAYNTAGNFWGARFDPPIYPCKITGMRVYFTSFPATYDDARMKIYAQDGSTVQYNYLDTSIDIGWNAYTVPAVQVLSGFFYAGTEWVTAYPNAPFIGTDSDPPISYMARQLISGIWYYDIEDAGVRVTVDAARVNNLVIRKTGGTDNVNINLSWTFPGVAGQTWYFIYKSDTPTGTYALVDSVQHPTQTWDDNNVPGFKKFYYVTFGDASGSRASTLPGEYLWLPFEITASSSDAIEPGVRPFAGEKVRQATHQ
jgi:hypothetical protein